MNRQSTQGGVEVSVHSLLSANISASRCPELSSPFTGGSRSEAVNAVLVEVQPPRPDFLSALQTAVTLEIKVRNDRGEGPFSLTVVDAPNGVVTKGAEGYLIVGATGQLPIETFLAAKGIAAATQAALRAPVATAA